MKRWAVLLLVAAPLWWGLASVGFGLATQDVCADQSVQAPVLAEARQRAGADSIGEGLGYSGTSQWLPPRFTCHFRANNGVTLTREHPGLAWLRLLAVIVVPILVLLAGATLAVVGVKATGSPLHNQPQPDH